MSQSSYTINFFFPKTEYARDCNRVIASILFIWALAVFGFQFLLKAIETPTPEPAFHTFEQIWGKIKDGTATVEEKKDIAKVYLTLQGKYIPLRNHEILRKTLTSTIYEILPESQRDAFVMITQEAATNKKINTDSIVEALGLSKDDFLIQVIPYGITPFNGEKPDAKMLESIPPLMNKYLVHNQSVLTDTKFLGFPFHYFYTAVFLLILFCGLCCYYCLVIDKIMKKYGLEKD
ncbi:MAG: DUF4212 domain-containing protein [SAR324 cluster bacterium]|nr:DUF4212 domain-containing protein [SAR324 cluster bacterium]